jgi:hypothetical protein
MLHAMPVATLFSCSSCR